MLFEDTGAPASDEELYDRVIGDSIDPVPESEVTSPGSAPSAPSHFADEWTSMQRDIDQEPVGIQQQIDEPESVSTSSQAQPGVVTSTDEATLSTSETPPRIITGESEDVGENSDVPWSYDEISELYPEVGLVDNDQ